ncbi:hypothetical protein [Actinoplanes subtropicus]|uniref:hypothetical protein n=1 Tax=Actinoplanes subtropicus TaxID=543632 RepID=UPI0004C31F9F|nr:hypothetical protein [Actinoplanes subtropicus]
MNDEEYGTSALTTLLVDPRPVTKVDLDQAVRDGRKIRRRRHWVAAAAVVALVAATAVGGTTMVRAARGPQPLPKPATTPVPADPTVPRSCTVGALPAGKTKSVSVVGGEPTGHWYVGTENPMALRTTGTVIWHDGRLVAELRGRDEIRMFAVNSAGVAVGWDKLHPVYIRDGVEVTMKGGAQPKAINSSGVVVGEGSPVDTRKSYAARWSSPDAEPQRLPDIGGRRAEGAYVVADNGLVIGNSSDRSALLLWYPDGRTKAVPVPSGAMFHPVAYRNGWIYVEMLGLDGGYRYAPATGVWQKLPSVVPATTSDDNPRIYAGPQSFALPIPPDLPAGAAFDITAMSDDARHIGGFTLASMADLAFPSGAFVWSCK